MRVHLVENDIRDTQAAMEQSGYIAEPPIATAVHLARSMQKPLLIEGDAGVGKTEIAKVMAKVLDTDLIRLQCYEGLDVNTALYEWNYQRQLLHLRVGQDAGRAAGDLEQEMFGPDFLLARPLLQAITHEGGSPVLLIDEIDRADDGFEAFLLEVLSDFQVTIPELGTITAKHIPYVVLTSNSTREIGDALRRRCLYLYIEHPSLEKEVRIIRMKVPGAGERLSGQIASFMQRLRSRHMAKAPGVAETLDWAAALVDLNRDDLDPETVRLTLGCIVKDKHDLRDLDEASLESLVHEVAAVE